MRPETSMFGPLERRALHIAAASLAVGLAASACSSPKTSTDASSTRPPQLPSPASPQAALWGDLKPVVSVKELMRDMLDPASDYIFDAVKVTFTKTGTIETKPTTDQDWDRVRIGAVTLAEGVYLLKIP